MEQKLVSFVRKENVMLQSDSIVPFSLRIVSKLRYFS